MPLTFFVTFFTYMNTLNIEVLYAYCFNTICLGNCRLRLLKEYLIACMALHKFQTTRVVQIRIQSTVSRIIFLITQICMLGRLYF